MSPGAAEDAPEARAWRDCRQLRAFQGRWGGVCALLLGLALLCVLDGLQSLRRTERDLLELLPGGSAAVSGPAGLRNPRREDVIAAFDPDAPQLTFAFDRFFTGYLMGGGMWRGQVLAAGDALPGRYRLRVRFRGAPARAAQTFPVIVHADKAARDAASTSYLRRLCGQAPFPLAGTACALGLAAGLAVYAAGRRRQRVLASLGLGEVAAVFRDTAGAPHLRCLTLGCRPPAEGSVCPVLDAGGAFLGEAVAGNARGGMLDLVPRGGFPAAAGCLVRLAPPAA